MRASAALLDEIRPCAVGSDAVLSVLELTRLQDGVARALLNQFDPIVPEWGLWTRRPSSSTEPPRVQRRLIDVSA